jgi:hypothetical protein
MVETLAGEGDLGIGVWISLATLIVESIIVILLYKTVRDYAEVAKLSRVEVKQRFRPWIGPSTGIVEFIRSTDGKEQYTIAIKNFGEIAATNVVAMSAKGNEMPSSRDILIKPPPSSSSNNNDNVDKFTLGPLLPNMEKRYSLFLDCVLMQKVREGNSHLFTTVYFSYEFSGGRAGYGMISQFDTKTGTFIHKDMWVD